MEFLGEVCLDKNVKCERFSVRDTARAILLNERGEVGLLHARNGGWYELVGGTVDAGEDLETALRREVAEEAGISKIEILGAVGMTHEYRNRDAVMRHNFCFVARVVAAQGATKLTEEESARESVVMFHSIDKAIELMRGAKPFGEFEYLGRYKCAGEVIFLERYRARKKS